MAVDWQPLRLWASEPGTQWKSLVEVMFGSFINLSKVPDPPVTLSRISRYNEWMDYKGWCHTSCEGYSGPARKSFYKIWIKSLQQLQQNSSIYLLICIEDDLENFRKENILKPFAWIFHVDSFKSWKYNLYSKYTSVCYNWTVKSFKYGRNRHSLNGWIK